jgi:hypothetical protein
MLSSSLQARAPQSLAERLGACPVSQGISLNAHAPILAAGPIILGVSPMAITAICDRCHRNQFGHYGGLQADTMFLFHRHEHALPFISWRNPVMPPRRRRTKYCGAISRGRKYMVLERACLNDNWVVVTVLTVLDGRPQVAA